MHISLEQRDAEKAKAKAEGRVVKSESANDVLADFLNPGVVSEEEEEEDRDKVSDAGSSEKGKGVDKPAEEESRGRRGRTARIVGFNAYSPQPE